MADSMSPSFVTVDEQGRIGADFTGHVFARGVDIEAADSDSPPNDRKLRWVRLADGAVVAESFGFAVGPGRTRVDRVTAAGESASFRSELYADDAPGVVQALLELSYDQGLDFAALTAGTQATGPKTVIDSDGASHFLQLLAALDVRINFGADVLTWPGGSAISGGTTIAHGLGAVPQAIVAICELSLAGVVSLGYSGVDASDVTFAGEDVSGTAYAADTQLDFYWLAIG